MKCGIEHKNCDRILGCLVGGAAGDALGYAIEFDREREIFSRYGRGGIAEYELYHGKAIFSDDTQMTLFTAAGLLLADAPQDYDSAMAGIYQAYLEWLTTQRGRYHTEQSPAKTWLRDIPELNIPRAPGNTCLSALGSGIMGTVENPINSSKGCGGVMRTAPVGLFYGMNSLSIEAIDRIAGGAAAITHGHPLGYIPAAGLAHIVQRLSHDSGMSLWEAVEDMISAMDRIYGADSPKDCAYFHELMERAMALSEDDTAPLDAIHQLGEGWVGEEALAIAVYCALKFPHDFDMAIRTAVNHNGDSDSTGAIAGNILGAYLGMGGIPAKYTEQLEQMDVLERMAMELCDGQMDAPSNHPMGTGFDAPTIGVLNVPDGWELDNDGMLVKKQ